MALYSLLSDLLRCERYWYYPGTSINSSGTYLSYGTNQEKTWYNSGITSDTDNGSFKGFPRPASVGGNFVNNGRAGSRAGRADLTGIDQDSYVTSRGCSQKKKNR